MDERALRFRVGVVVLAASLITVILVLRFGSRPRFSRDTYKILVRFPSASGVAVDTPVRKSGIQIGWVSDVELLDEGGVRLTMQIDSQYTLKRSEVCRIGTASLVTGDAKLEFMPRDKRDPSYLAEFDTDRSGDLDAQEEAAAAQPIKDGDYLANGQVAKDPLQVIVDAEERIGGAFLAMQDTAVRISRLVTAANAALGNNDDQLRRIIQKTELAVDSFRTASNSFNQLIADPQIQQDIRDTLRKMPGTVDKLNDTIGEFDRRLKAIGGEAERVVANLATFTEPLAKNGDRLATGLVNTLQNVDKLTAELSALAESINRGEGTLGRLVYEDHVYQDLRKTIKRFDRVMLQVELIARDARVAVDKVARDPYRLGVPGLLNRRSPGGKQGYPVGDAEGYFGAKERLRARPQSR